ncbi:MAG: tail fiber protein [Bryobacteraceae bacterium]|nr:tail fiber protein [Bryobacteraceae bacterium]
MSEAFLGEIRMFSFDFPPKGWATCDGQLLPINQNQALFALLGTTYGGNGQTTFALPNLQARTPMHASASHPLGERLGEVAHTLSINEMPPHSHAVNASSGAGSSVSPSGKVWAQPPGLAVYSPTGGAAMSANATGVTGASQAHSNMQPFLTLNFSIALQGIFPSQP